MPRPSAFSPICALVVAAASVNCGGSPRPAPPAPAVVPAAEPTAATYERACDGGDLWSCTVLGFAYQLGDDKLHIPIDWKLGAAYFERACNGKVPEACLLLNQMYEVGGKNLPADLTRAAAPLRILCSEGHTEYCNREPRELPYAYRGDGVNPDRPTP